MTVFYVNKYENYFVFTKKPFFLYVWYYFFVAHKKNREINCTPVETFTEKNNSSNQLFSNCFSKNVTFTKFSPNLSESKVL